MRIMVASLFAALLVSGCGAHATIAVRPGYFFGYDLRSAKSVVYVLDLSGSMQEASGSVLEQAGTNAAAKVTGSVVGGLLGHSAGRTAQSAIQKLRQKIEKVKLHLIASLNGLPAGSQFNVILFANGVQRLAPGMIVVSPASVGLVSAFVSQLEAGGSTSLYRALQAGLSLNSRNVLLLTDGLPTDSTPEQILQLARQANPDHHMIISTVGVGDDQDFGFLRQLARENGGAFISYQ